MSSLVSLLVGTLSLSDHGPILMTSFISLEASSSNIDTLGLGLQCMNLGRGPKYSYYSKDQVQENW